MKEPLCNSIASHFVECGVRELVTNHSLSSLSALLRRLQASSTVELGSVSSRECLDAPAILATFTAGRTGLVNV